METVAASSALLALRPLELRWLQALSIRPTQLTFLPGQVRSLRFQDSPAGPIALLIHPKVLPTYLDQAVHQIGRPHRWLHRRLRQPASLRPVRVSYTVDLLWISECLSGLSQQFLTFYWCPVWHSIGQFP